MSTRYDVVIVGAGFTGLSAAFYLSEAGFSVKVIEADEEVGGLAGVFKFEDGVTVDKFYHHWFNNDQFINRLAQDLGVEKRIQTFPSKTAMFYNDRIWKLSSPLDLLKFRALSFPDRIRLGLLVYQVRFIRDWREIEHLTIEEWLVSLCGKKIYDVVWRPLVESKFSQYSGIVSAVWMWKKLVLRGGTRNAKGEEELLYFEGGFAALAKSIVERITANGGEISLSETVKKVVVNDGIATAIETTSGLVEGESYLLTPATPIIADMFDAKTNQTWLYSLKKINYLGNICLVLRMSQSLSDTYWLNVNDPGFPFVGIIEHTNFDSSPIYNGSKIAYLSKYLSTDDEVWNMTDEQYFLFSMEHIKQMFPDFSTDWVQEYKVWRAEFAQPIAQVGYSKIIPKTETPISNVYLSTMAQIYPEDRGTNYAVREGYRFANKIIDEQA